MKLGGNWISGTEHWELNATGVLRGLCRVTTWDVLFLTGVDSSMADITPGDVALKLT